MQHPIEPTRTAAVTARPRGLLQRAGAIGWALLVWLFGGSAALAILVFIVLKMFGD